jgi:hypothetical protein
MDWSAPRHADSLPRADAPPHHRSERIGEPGYRRLLQVVGGSTGQEPAYRPKPEHRGALSRAVQSLSRDRTLQLLDPHSDQIDQRTITDRGAEWTFCRGNPGYYGSLALLSNTLAVGALQKSSDGRPTVSKALVSPKEYYAAILRCETDIAVRPESLGLEAPRVVDGVYFASQQDGHIRLNMRTRFAAFAEFSNALHA